MRRASAEALVVEDGASHFVRGSHVDPDRTHRCRKRARRSHERHFRTAVESGLGQSEALLAGRAVREDAHRIDRLLGASRRHDEAPSRERTVPAGRATDVAEDLLRLEHAAASGEARSHPALGGPDHGGAARAEHREIRLDGGVLEHAGIHRGSDEERTARREGRHGEEIVGEPVRELREEVGGRRRDEEESRAFGEADVQDVGLRAPEVRVRGAPRERLKRQRRDESGRCSRQDRVHARAGLRELAREIGGLVSSDGAADAEEDSLPAEDRDLGHQSPTFIS